MNRHTVFEYINKKYRTLPEYPWQNDNSSAVFRHADNRKWFALVMDVQRNRLGLAGSDPVEVVNLKIDDMFFRDMIIREEGILPAYHMSKIHWVTVFLDGTVPEQRVYELLDMSFMATASAKKRRTCRYGNFIQYKDSGYIERAYKQNGSLKNLKDFRFE